MGIQYNNRGWNIQSIKGETYNMPNSKRKRVRKMNNEQQNKEILVTTEDIMEILNDINNERGYTAAEHFMRGFFVFPNVFFWLIFAILVFSNVSTLQAIVIVILSLFNISYGFVLAAIASRLAKKKGFDK